MRNRLALTALGILAVFFFSIHQPWGVSKEKRNGLLSIESEKVRKSTLDNGLIILVKSIPHHPIVTVQALVRAGLSFEAEYSATGISHFIEHMLFKGTPTRPVGAIEKEVKSFGGEINGATGLDAAYYYITVPKEYYKNALEILADMTLNAKIPIEEFEKERGVILNEVRMGNDEPGQRVMKLLWGTSYLFHPYRYPVIGYEELLGNLTHQDLLKYYKSRYAPNNILITIAGDVKEDEAIEEASKIFNKYKRSGVLNIAPPEEPEQIAGRESTERMDINLGYMALGFHTTALQHKDLYKLDVLAIILGKGEGSRLYKDLVREKGLLFTVSASNYTPLYPGLFIVTGVGKPENMESAKNEILAVIEDLKKERSSQEELAKAKRMVLAEYLDNLQTTHGQAHSIAQGEFFAGDPDFYADYVQGINNVEAADIKEAADKYLKPTNLSMAIVLPRLKKETVPESSVEKVVLSMPEMVTLDNGVRIILKEDRRVPTISIALSFQGGLRRETIDTNGISHMTSTMLTKGTKSRTEDAISPALESLGAGIKAYSGFNSFGLTLTFIKEDMTQALDILEDVIKNPVFPVAALAKEKEKVFAAITGEDDDIFQKGVLTFRKEFFKNHPYGMRVIGEKESVWNLTERALAEFYSRFASAENLVIGVVGDFDKVKLLAELGKRFGDIKEAQVPPLDLKPVIPSKTEKNLSVLKEQALVIMGFPAPDMLSKDKYGMSVLSSILSGQDGRLFKAIRQEAGESYVLGALYVPGIDTGYFLLYAATTPGNEKNVSDKMLREVKKIRAEPAGDGEVDSAKRELIAGKKTSLQSNLGLALEMCLDELYGLGYGNYFNYEKMIDSITKVDIKNLAVTWLEPEKYTLIILSPDAANQ